jgi:hypothetical protein
MAKTLRPLVSKYGLSTACELHEPVQRTLGERMEEMRQGTYASVVASAKVFTDHIQRLRTESAAFQRAIELEVKEALRPHLPAFLSPKLKYIDANGYVVSGAEATLSVYSSRDAFNHDQMPSELRRTFQSDIDRITATLQFSGSVLLHDSVDFDRSRPVSFAEALNAFVSSTTQTLDDMNLEHLAHRNITPTDKAVGMHYPLKRNVKSWLRKMGINARNDSGDVSYEVCGREEEDSPCKAVRIIGPRTGSDDLRAYAAFAQKLANVQAYLEQRGLLRNVTEEAVWHHGANRTATTLHLDLTWR